jgi:hypothetical protein
MIDIETIDSAPKAAVIAIGACVFTADGVQTGDFSVVVNAELAKAYGTVGEQTMAWWATQDAGVRERMFSGLLSPYDAAKAFCNYVRESHVDEVWANSPTFDCVILRHLFAQLGMRAPWHFRDERCVRTVYAVGRELGVDFNAGYSEQGAHDAVVDARNQARAVGIILKAFADFEEKAWMYEGLES